MTDELIIRDEALAKVLLEPKTLSLLELLLDEEKTLTELAERLELKLNTLHYRINALIKLGLVELSRERSRSGRATKLYQSSAKKFLIPAELIPHAYDEQLLDGLAKNIFEGFQRDFAKALEDELGPRYIRLSNADNRKGITIDNVFEKDPLDAIDPDSPAIMQSVGIVRLNFAEAKAFQKDLAELFKKYVDNQDSKGQAYYRN